LTRRVVITGAGVVSSIGSGRAAFWDALIAGRSGASRIELEGVGEVTVFLAADDEGAEELVGRRESRRMDRAARLAVVAAAQALADAGGNPTDPARTGAVIANVHGGADTLQRASVAFLSEGLERVSPFTVPLGLTNAPVAAVMRINGFRGPSSTVATACAAGTDAIGLAAMLIRSGRAEAILAGGAEAPVSPLVVAGYRRLGALSTSERPAAEASRPFDRSRDGFVIAEGAGIILLEEREHALERGATILGELAGYGSSSDAGHITDPDESGQGAARAITIALAEAGVAPAEIGHVNAHATSTPAGDIAEARAIVAAGLGHSAVSATKSLHGHTLGAAGGIEAIAALMPLVRDVLPATANLDDPEPDPPLDHVRETRAAHIEVAVSNSFGFGGHNAAIVLRRT
jgi:3-oxoacyl-[acyl-carrier-protein] synthase II